MCYAKREASQSYYREENFAFRSKEEHERDLRDLACRVLLNGEEIDMKPKMTAFVFSQKSRFTSFLIEEKV